MNDQRMVLFDLDGTLVDTAPDMAAALNRLREQEGLAALPFAAIRNTVSKGSPALVDLGFGTELEPDLRQSLQQRFLETYSQALCAKSKLFDGMQRVLSALDRADVRWGIVTNKPGWLTEPLLEQLDLRARSAAVVSGDTLARRKPFPDPLLHACRIAGRDPAGSVYVGDDERDVRAAEAAGMTALIAGWGYIDTDESPQGWGADAIMHDVDELLARLQQQFIDNTT